MDENQNKINNVETKICPHCGALNNKDNNFCINCGSMLNGNTSPTQTPTQSNQQVNDVQNPQKEKEKNPYKGLMITLGIASAVLTLFVEKAIPYIVIAAVASIFSKKTRPYGLTILIAMGVGFVVGFIFIIIIFGMCIAGLGGY